MSNNFIKSSPLDGLQNELKSSSSVVSFESILTNSRLLDKLELSNDDEYLLLQQMNNENDNFNHNNNDTFSNATNTTSTHAFRRVAHPNGRIPSHHGRNQGGNAARLVSIPASQFPSLRTGSTSVPNNNPIAANDVRQPLTSSFNKEILDNKNSIANTSIKNILNDVTFKDKSIQSKVEQHYSNTCRFSYIVEEGSNSVNNKIIENFTDNVTNLPLRRNHNFSTKSNLSTNTHSSEDSLQLSTTITQATTHSDSPNISIDGSSTPSPSSTSRNDKKPTPTFLKSHKKKNSLTSLKKLFKNNKNKNSTDSTSKKTGSNESLSNESTESLNPPAHSISHSSNKTSSKLIFSPQPHLNPNHPTVPLNNNSTFTNYQCFDDKHSHNVIQSSHNNYHIQSNDTLDPTNKSAFNSNDLLSHNGKISCFSKSNETILPDPSYLLNKTNDLPARRVHQRSHSAFTTSTTSGYTTPAVIPISAEITSSSNPSSASNLAEKYYHPHPSKPSQTMPSTPARNNTYSSHSRNKSLQDEDLIATAIDMRKAGNLHASALRLRQACQKGNRTAFLLYGLALRYGYGVDTDYIQSFYYIKLSTAIKSWHNEVFNLNVDPFRLERNLDAYVPTKLEEPLVPALYECGIAYLKGFGAPDIDEFKGLKCLEKAASMGHVDSMCLSGIIWSQDQEAGKLAPKSSSNYESRFRKKDVAKAASWFRIADKRGANLIGSDWIYKDKYLKAAMSR